MDRNDLKEYLEIVIDMENSIQLQEKTIECMRNTIASLKNSGADIVKPVKPQKKSGGEKIVSLSWLFLLVGIPLLIYWFGYACMGSFQTMPYFTSVLALLIGGFLTYLGLGSLFNGLDQKASENAYNEQMEKDYVAALAKYELDIKQNELLAKQNGVRTSVYEHELNLMQRQLQESKDTLAQIYSANIIWHKYRNLPMLCSLYEYIVSGRTDSLDGKEGAYNILELEMRLDKLITQMDKILSNLEAIRNNQYMLYSAINECNDRMSTLLSETQRLSHETVSLAEKMQENSDKLSHGIGELNKTSAVAMYYNQRTAKELHYMNRMDYLTGRNNGTFFNQPPSD